jgi:hypothetical protein
VASPCPATFVNEHVARPPCPTYPLAEMIPGGVSTLVVGVAGFIVLLVVVLTITSIVLWSIGET